MNDLTMMHEQQEPLPTVTQEKKTDCVTTELPLIDVVKRDIQSTVASHPKQTTKNMMNDYPFWRDLYDVTAEEFLDDRWQAQHAVKNVKELQKVVGDRTSPDFFADVAAGIKRSPMSMRITPYTLSLIDWGAVYDDPLRIQFIPVASRLLPDHPKLGFDSLHEQIDSPIPGLTHRYPNKVLFLTLNTCPVYCRFCTRSYDVGPVTEISDKAELGVDPDRWRENFDYIASHPEIVDIVISGGDTYQLRPEQIKLIGMTLLDIPTIKRIRFATKGPAVMPQKILSDSSPWLNALTGVVDYGRTMEKEVALHTHVNHPNEITWITEQAMKQLYKRGIVCRNQSVLLRGVNDTNTVMNALVKKLGDLHVDPYYVYVHDLVKGVEDLRTTLQTALDIEKNVRGTTAGFLTPTFVMDAPGGGGKRDAHSFEYYDRMTGVSVYTSPVKPGRFFIYFDPIHLLPEEGQSLWADPSQHQIIIDKVITIARNSMTAPSTF